MGKWDKKSYLFSENKQDNVPNRLLGRLHKRSMVTAQGYIFRTPCAETAQGPYRRAKMLKTRRACTGASVEAGAAFLALSGQVD